MQLDQVTIAPFLKLKIMLTPVKPNYEKKPLRIYVSKKTGRIFPLSEDETHIELDKPLERSKLSFKSQFFNMAKVHIPFRIRRSIDGQYFFVILAKNGQVLATSETYTHKKNCIKGTIALAALCFARISNDPLAWDDNGRLYKDETIKAVRVN